MSTIAELKKRSLTERRRLIKPTAVVESRTPQGKSEIVRAVRRVIAEHHAVLAALKD